MFESSVSIPSLCSYKNKITPVSPVSSLPHKLIFSHTFLLFLWQIRTSQDSWTCDNKHISCWHKNIIVSLIQVQLNSPDTRFYHYVSQYQYLDWKSKITTTTNTIIQNIWKIWCLGIMHPLFLLVPTKTTIKIFPLTNLWHTLDEVSPSQLTTADH